MKGKTEGVRKLWDKYKFVGLTVLIGVGLLLWPSGKKMTGTTGSTPTASAPAGTERDLQTDMEEILGAISGVGQVKVLLTVDSDGERQLAQNTELAYSGATAAPEDNSRRSQPGAAGGPGGGGTGGGGRGRGRHGGGGRGRRSRTRPGLGVAGPLV